MIRPLNFPLLSLLLFMPTVTGCIEGGAVAFREHESFDYTPLLSAVAAVQRSSIEDVEANPSPIVQTTSRPTQRTLVTLPRGGNLNAYVDGAPGPVLIDFFADWCGPCRAQGRILHEVEGAAAETQTLIIKVNIDDHPELAREYQVSSLPTLMMVRNGRVIQRQTGVANKARLVNWMR